MLNVKKWSFLQESANVSIRRRRLRNPAGSKVESQQEEGWDRGRSVRMSKERAYRDYFLGSGEQLQMSEWELWACLYFIVWSFKLRQQNGTGE